MSFLHKILQAILFTCLTTGITEARWGKYEDAKIEFKLHNYDLEINQDGTSEAIIEVQEKILKEAGRDRAARYIITYDETSDAVEILSAKTIYNGEEYIVTKEMIEDKPLASIGHGFDQLKQILISFPKTEIGAEIYIKYKLKTSKVAIDNFFGDVFYYGDAGYWQNGRVKINSKIPLNIVVNNPKEVLTIKKDSERNFHFAEISLSKPLYAELVNEPNNGVLDVKHSTWVSLSSLNDWAELAQKIGEGYSNVINQPLPEVFSNIAKTASKAKTDEEKINIVTSLLNEKIQYMGDWRAVEGRYFPRNLNQIATSQVGDCKDFSAITAAILKKLGYKAQPILVMRGETNFSNPDILPCLCNFNHVMLRVINKDDKIYWVDPTNLVSMAQGIFPDIANKLVLNLDQKEAGYIKIPNISKAEVISHASLNIKDYIVDEEGTMKLNGERATSIAGAGLYYSDEQLKDFAFRILSGTYLDTEEKKYIKLPNLTSRIVEDLTFTYAFQQKDKIFKTNMGLGFNFESNWVDDVVSGTSEQISDSFLGMLEARTRFTIIKNIKIKDCDKLDFAIDTPWVAVSRTCQYKDNNTEFTDKLVVKKNFITSEEISTNQYRELKNKLNQDFKKATIILSE